MKKTTKIYKSYKALSRKEAQLLSVGEPLVVITPSTLQKLIRWKKSSVHNTLASLKKKGVLLQIKKGVLTLAEKLSENLFAAATEAHIPSYISFWTAVSYYGWTEQQVQALQLVSTKQFPKNRLQQHLIEIVTVRPEKFFGYHRQGNFSIVEKEKLIVEMLSKPELCGGMEEIRKCLRAAWKEINEDLLYFYLLRWKNKSSIARLGYLLEELHLKHHLKNGLLKNISRSYVCLNPAKGKSQKYNHRWKVNIND